jgi:hypothetical protein
VRKGPNKAPGQPEQEPKRSKVSINNYPESYFNADEREAKVVIDDEPTILNYFAKLGIRNLVKNTVGMVLLKNQKKEVISVLKLEILSADVPSSERKFQVCQGTHVCQGLDAIRKIL